MGVEGCTADVREGYAAFCPFHFLNPLTEQTCIFVAEMINLYAVIEFGTSCLTPNLS
jgi:hypothetical protein